MTKSKAAQAQAQTLAPVRRSLVRTGMVCFVTDDGEPIQPAPHQILMAQIYEWDWLGPTAVDAPPEHAKSNWIGIYGSAYYLGHHPEGHILYLTSSSELANKVSVAVRDTIEGNDRYRALFPNLVPNKSKGWGEIEWFLDRPNLGDKDATFLAKGRNGQIIGVRASRILLDDINDEEEQSSDIQRQKTRNWVSATALSRLVKGGRAFAIQTRWHEEDILGWCLEQHWTHLHFEAIAEEDGRYKDEQTAWLTVWDETRYVYEHKQKIAITGKQMRDRVTRELVAAGWRFTITDEGAESGGEHRWVFAIHLHDDGPALWPAFVPFEKLLARRRELGPVRFAAMYQGRPVPAGGAIIPTESIRNYPWTPDRSSLPPMSLIIQSWDTAFQKGSRNDYSVCTTWGLTLAGDFYLLDFFRDRKIFGEVKQEVKNQFLAWKPSAVLIENAASGQSIIQELTHVAGLPIVKVNPRDLGIDKVARVHSVTGYFLAGQVYLPDTAPWRETVIREYALFDKAAHDDIVDASVIGLRWLIDAAIRSMGDEDFYEVCGEAILGDLFAREV